MFCDISKAFDRVWHKGLLLKLKCVGIRGSLLKWFSNYLLDRKQRVVIPGASSDWSSVTADVPQGSILGPLLFLIFINDIVVDLDTNVRLFADDTSLYIIVDTPVNAALKLNSSLSPDPFFASLFSFLFVRDTNLAHPIKLFTSLPCLKRKGLYTNVTDLRQNSADRPFNLSLCGF